MAFGVLCGKSHVQKDCSVSLLQVADKDRTEDEAP